MQDDAAVYRFLASRFMYHYLARVSAQIFVFNTSSQQTAMMDSGLDHVESIRVLPPSGATDEAVHFLAGGFFNVSGIPYVAMSRVSVDMAGEASKALCLILPLQP